MEVLLRLAQSPGETLSKDELIRSVWPGTFVGDDALARAIYELRKALDDDPHDPKYIQTISKRGYRLVAEVDRGLQHETKRNDPGHRDRLISSRYLRVAIVFAVVAVAIGIAVVGWNIGGIRDRLHGTTSEQPITSIAILPLENLSKDPQEEYFADGMTEALITSIGRFSGLKKVIAPSSVMQYKRLTKPLDEIARDLKVDALVTGAVLRSSGRVRITAQLVDPSSGKQLWSGRFERPMADILILQDELVAEIANEIRLQVGPTDLPPPRTVNPEAYNDYLMGSFYSYKMNPAGLKLALNYFDLALHKDPNHAPAYAGIAYVWILTSHSGFLPPDKGFSKARAASLKALELDEYSAEVHDMLGTVLNCYDWNWSAGEREFQRAIDLNPNFAHVHFSYSMVLHAVGRQKEADEQMARTLALAPYDSFYETAAAVQLLNQNKPNEALKHLQKALLLQPDSSYARNTQWLALEAKGDFEHAIVAAVENLKLLEQKEIARAVEEEYSIRGYKAAMLRLANEQSRRRKEYWIPSVAIAGTYAYVGDYDRAMQWLETAYRERSSNLVYVKVLYRLKPLHSDPRYQEVVRRMKFPE